MLVEINLLPEKEPRNIAPFIVAGSIVLLVMSLTIVWLLQYQQANRELLTVSNELQLTKATRAIEEQKILDSTSTSSLSQLEQTVAWMEKYPIDVVPILAHVSGLLPDRGFLLSFSLGENGNVNITTQFDTSRESAYYLHNLQQSEWVTDVNLNSITTKQIEEATQSGLDEFELMPRYIATYQITLNQLFINALQHNEEETS
ncbi:hypothetical protein EJF36_14665 [Bacillus sp. HMF5848]|uniref:PilN domain-containing protein n=1 Tax=Bacillus sp. HMF5848 TaxID=2495421 RepID=UPI000F78BD7D|nr:PilN domain-containing protein [Bacillus sp. HMF5848]RSK28020.1 hypothetical protein EJF36_14665 [Bacillus sp. HMF5848]